MYPSSSAFSPDDYPMPYSPNMVPNGNPPMQPADYPLQHQQYLVSQQDFGMMYPHAQQVPFNPCSQNMQSGYGMNFPGNQGYAYNTVPCHYDHHMSTAIPNSMDFSATVPYPDPNLYSSSNNFPINTPNPNFGNFAPFSVENQENISHVSGKMKRKKEKKMSTMHRNTSCSNCGTRETAEWRRNELGEPECNACNQYFGKKGVARPQNLWNKPTATRKRRPTAPIANENQEDNQ